MKKFSVFLAAFLLLIGSTTAYLYFHFMPQYEGVKNIPGMKAPVGVYFDAYGIPHIEARNRQDLYRAYGYIVAQDRFFQIQLQKRISAGRLSEWFGEPTLETDKTLRNIGFYRWSKAWLERNQAKLNPELLADAQAWLEGVNQCMDECPRPIEMVLLNAHPEKLEMADIFAFAGSMAFSFNKSYFMDAVMTDVGGKLTPAMISELAGEKVLTTPHLQAKLKLPLLNQIDPLDLLPNMEGSQSWVVAPSKSASGQAVLANDPHIGFSHPGVWYEAHLKAPGFELYGHFIPIIPFALIGHNQDKAWALTMSNADDLDLVLQKDVESFSTVVEKIHVKGQEAPVDFEVKMTEWGPVLSQVLKADRNFIMHWQFFTEDNFVVESFYDLNHAKTIEQFDAALAKGNAPGLNISWADKQGNIAWKVFGRFPARTQEHWKALELSPGQAVFSSEYPKAENPGIRNPSNGFILSANQKPPLSYDETKYKGYWDSSERYETLHKRLQAIEKVTLEDHKKLFMTDELEGAQTRLQKMLQEVQVEDSGLLEVLNSWGGDADKDNKALAFYFEWMDAIARETLLQKLTEKQLEQFCDTNAYWIFVNKIVDNPQSEWWSGKRAETLQSSFDYTYRFMKNKYGAISNWRWGQLHTWTLENPLGKVKPLDKVFNLGPFEVEGSFMAPNALRHKFCRGSFEVGAGPSTRRVVDFGNPLKSWGVLPAGNSGVVLSPYYKNQVDLYLKGELRPEWLDWAAIKAESKALLLQ